MKNLSKFAKKRGVILVAAIAIMLIVAVLCVALASMLGVTSRGSLDYWRSSQAFALVQAGLNWYMEQLTNTVDWDTTTNQTGISLNPGTFDVILSNKVQPQTDSTTVTRMDIAVTGKVTGNDGRVVQRTMSQRVWKLPSASKFALFWGRRTGTTLTFTNVAITGNYWSIGTTAIPAGSIISSGTGYYPTTENITGAGTYTKFNVGTFPYFSGFTGSTATYSTPSINSTYYTGLISGYNTAIATSPATSDCTQSSGTFTVSGTMRCRDVSITGTTTIAGNGTLIANGSATARGVMTLGSTTGGPVTVTPSAGGSIIFLSRRSMTVNNVTINNANNPSPDYVPRVRMYSRAAGATSDLLTIQRSANLDKALIMSDRRILVQTSTTSPTVTDSVLFVNNNTSSATNNNLTVTGSAVVGNLAAGPCSLISIARGAPALAITTTASVTGFVYQKNATLATGFTNIAGTSNASRVNITGTVIANQFTGNAISNANITYDPTVIPDPPAEGFDSFATKDPDSWSGN